MNITAAGIASHWLARMLRLVCQRTNLQVMQPFLVRENFFFAGGTSGPGSIAAAGLYDCDGDKPRSCHEASTCHSCYRRVEKSGGIRQPFLLYPMGNEMMRR